MKAPLPSIFVFLFLISHLVTTTTIVVIATEIQAEEAGIVNDIGESAILTGQQERQALRPPEDAAADTNTINNTKENVDSVDDSAISEGNGEDASSEISDSEETDDANSSEELSKDDVIENEVEEVATESLEDDKTSETENITRISSEEENVDEMSETNATEMDTIATLETDEEEEEIPPTSSSSTPESTSSESVSEDGIESAESSIEGEETTSASSEETTTESVPKSTEENEAVEVASEEEADVEAVPEDLKDEGENNTETEKSQNILPSDDGETKDDLDGDSEQLEASDSLEETQTDEDIESESSEEEDSQANAELSDKAEARARAREDRLKAKSINATTPEELEPAESTTAATYRGEPWGQFRSFRRLPDLELLRLVFENSNKTRAKSSGDAESQRVVNDWQKDPLYDEKMAKQSGSGEPYLGDEQDPQFREYRANLLKTGSDTKLATDTDKATEDEEDTSDTNPNSNNADVNSEFGDGLDDIDKFFEGVNPPDELDVGYGSSIQDVLIDKGKDILLKKIRGFAHWIKVGWKTMGPKLEERISQFELPFHKIEDTISTASDTVTKTLGDKEQREELVEKSKNVLSTVLKVGKQTVEVLSDFVDGLLDRFDDRGEDESANFEDFGGFDLDDLSSFKPPV